ncbi:hypothetical protein NQ318_006951 [Aromia moschata]|uniref:RNase H type-1 domain-containing protein n=1 Tax=Aromia moschata TaxID=1265417 RepID=A0AAV8Y7Y7_9CUCU|nr:hypothetical protein NQ318_006951 [Aromia moschata]
MPLEFIQANIQHGKAQSAFLCKRTIECQIKIALHPGTVGIPRELGCRCSLAATPTPHHTMGDKEVKPRAGCCSSSLTLSDRQIANRGSVPTYFTPERQSVIDLTLCSTELLSQVGCLAGQLRGHHPTALSSQARLSQAELLTKDPGAKLGAVSLHDGGFTSSAGGPLQHLLSVHFPGSAGTVATEDDNGSKIGDKAGAGVYGKTTRTRLSFALGSYASVFQAEIYDILACGMEILKTAPKRRTIQICTDSQAALMAIESSKVKSRLILDCKKILNDLASCNRVILTWVPGHSGVPGNEEADRLARLGSIGYPIGPEPILGVPYSMGVSTMKELLNKEFEKYYTYRRTYNNNSLAPYVCNGCALTDEVPVTSRYQCIMLLNAVSHERFICGLKMNDILNNGVLSSFASDLDTAKQILLQNFNQPTETVFFQEPMFFGGLRHSQKEESRFKLNHAEKGHPLQEPMKMSIEYE